MSDCSNTMQNGRMGRICFRIFCALFLFLCIAVFLFGPLRDGYYFRVAVGTGGAVLIVCAAVFLRRFWAKIPLWTLLLLCLVVKLGFVLLFRVEPEADYHTFYITALDMSRGVLPQVRSYLALFPHILGYSAFLSVFLRLFGESTLVPAVLNALLSVLSMGLLFGICRRLISRKAAVLASLIWIFFPSQMIYNMYVLSEPLYTALLLSALYLLARRGGQNKTAILLGTALGILCAAVQPIRPVGMILLFAIVLYELLLRCSGGIKGKLSLVLAAVLVFVACTTAVGNLVDRYLGEKSGGYGYSIYVGLDPEHGGIWNAEAAHRLDALAFQDGATAKSVQDTMLQEGLAQFRDREISASAFFAAKLGTLMGQDCAAVSLYSGEVFGGYKDLLAAICDAAWYALLFLACLGCAFAIFSKTDTVLAVPVLYGLGLIFAHMITEAAQRYHYSALICLIPLAVFGLESSEKLLSKHLTKGKG